MMAIIIMRGMVMDNIGKDMNGHMGTLVGNLHL